MTVIVTITNGEKFNIDLAKNGLSSKKDLNEAIQFTPTNILEDNMGNVIKIGSIMYYNGVNANG